jgi:hypothetical protein
MPQGESGVDLSNCSRKISRPEEMLSLSTSIMRTGTIIPCLLHDKEPGYRRE